MGLAAKILKLTEVANLGQPRTVQRQFFRMPHSVCGANTLTFRRWEDSGCSSSSGWFTRGVGIFSHGQKLLAGQVERRSGESEPCVGELFRALSHGKAVEIFERL